MKEIDNPKKEKIKKIKMVDYEPKERYGKSRFYESCTKALERAKRAKIIKIKTCFGEKYIPEGVKFFDGPNCYICNELVNPEEHQQFTTLISGNIVCAHAGCAKLYKGIIEGRYDEQWFYRVKCTSLKITFDNVMIAAAYLRKNNISTRDMSKLCDMITKCCDDFYESIYTLEWKWTAPRKTIRKPEHEETKRTYKRSKKKE